MRYIQSINPFNFLFLLLLMLLLIQCTAKNPRFQGRKNLNIAKEDVLNAQYYLYKNSDTTAILFFDINTDYLLFSRLDTGMQFYAKIKVHAQLYSKTKNILTDSVSSYFYIPQNNHLFFGQIALPVGQDEYGLKLNIIDANKNNQYSYFSEYNLSNDQVRNNFLPLYNDKVLVKPYIPENSTVKILYRKKNPFLNVDVFNYNHNPAPPPFANITPALNYKPDSSFVITLQENSYYPLNVQKNKYYHIRPDNNLPDGITIFSIDSVFPNIKDAREMLYTTRYIMSKNEFERCNQATSIAEVKKCIDNFWIQISGSKERAKEVIKNYYSKVINANLLFTSYKYGWQTDRGMIYIIFGPPEDIQKNIHTEKWYYSVNGQKNALFFIFNRNKSNPFTPPDFVLERSDYYKDWWYLSVDKIRQGRLSIK